MLEAVLLVGGLGTRLRPLTLTTPKPMLPVAGVPFIAYQFAKLRAAGVEHVVLATSYKPQVFSEYFGDGSDQRLRITYVHEQQPLGTGGAIRNAAAALTGGQDEPIIVLNGDVLSGHDLKGQLLLHQESEAVVTLHLVKVDDARAYGCVPTTPEGQVTGFLEKMPEPVTQWVNGGAYVFSRSAVDEIPAGRVVSVERDTFPELLANGAHIHSWKGRAYWMDVGTPAAYVRCSADVVLGAASVDITPPVGSHRSAGSLVLAGASIGEGVQLSDGTTVGRAASLGQGARVEGSIVMDGAAVGAGATIRRSVIGNNASVSAHAVLEDCVHVG